MIDGVLTVFVGVVVAMATVVVVFDGSELEEAGFGRLRLPREEGAIGAGGGIIVEEVFEEVFEVTGSGNVLVTEEAEAVESAADEEPSVVVVLLIEAKIAAACAVVVALVVVVVEDDEPATDGRRDRTLVVGRPVGGNMRSMPTERLPVGRGYVSASPRASEEGSAKLP